mmetsp:Transcript_47128/g.98811  ORF Transcript_47128/g.98811 Transcript_47128/m.98811 type:complete len:655 (+) Transcript_47128:94-2058(+)
MSLPCGAVSKNCYACKRPFGTRQSLRGTCKHSVCVDCIANEDAARRSFVEGSACALSLPCTDPQCDGRFNIKELRTCEVYPDAIASCIGVEVEKGVSSSGDRSDVPHAQIVRIKREKTLEIQIPFKARSDDNVVVKRSKLHAESAVSCGEIKSECFDCDTEDDNSRFSDITCAQGESIIGNKTSPDLAVSCSKVADHVVASTSTGGTDDALSQFAKAKHGQSPPPHVTPTPLELKSELKSHFNQSNVGGGSSTPCNEVKTERLDIDANDSDDDSRFSDVTSEDKVNPYKQETDEEDRVSESNKKEGSDADSRFSDVSDVGDPECEKPASIKEEPTFDELRKRVANKSRKYGDRVLLARQSKIGMMKLGGGNQSSYLFPKDQKQRLARMGGRYAMAYNCQWNFGAPKYAGQPSGHVTLYPGPDDDYVDDEYDPEKCPFSVFVMRTVKQTTLGWEYCGEYVLLDVLKGTTRAHNVSQDDKKFIFNDIKKSLERENGLWHDHIEYLREKIMEKCERDPSKPGPTRLIRLGFIRNEPEPEDEGKEREERLERESREKATDAAKARALGLNKKNLSHIEFARRIIHYDDFYGSYSIKFVKYDEEMYDFVKNGMTTKNKRNKKRAENEPCAKAIDWYNIMDQQIEGNEKERKKQMKRKRT